MSKKIQGFHSTTRFLHCEGATKSGWASCAAALKRCQVHDRKQFGRRDWADYPANRWGWITDTGRCVGAGEHPAPGLIRKDELLLAIRLPFEGSGTTLRIEAEKFVKTLNKKMRAA